MAFRRKKYSEKHEIAPDEIFLDSKNLPDFNVDQFEGRIEKSISKQAVFFLGASFLLLGVIFLGRLVDLQIVSGASYAERSENNRLKHIPIFSERGVVFDRNGKELAWNIPGDDDFSKRAYIDRPGFAHVLGYINYPQKDNSGFYYQTEFVGKDGVEGTYNEVLSGEDGVKIVEVDVFGKKQSESLIYVPRDGNSITLTIDAGVQEELSRSISGLAKEVGFDGGAGVVMDVQTGEILAITSVPEYDSNVLSEGEDKNLIAKYILDEDKPFLNRSVSGLYTPGSTVKPFVGIGALNEGVITPNKEILSTGSISVQNPYFPDLETVFNDWKAHGLVNIKDALAVSSNVYFFEVGGGYGDQEGIGIANIERYVRMFGLGEKTNIDLPGEVDGIIPNPKWKAEVFDGDEWRVGDTYNTAIGQYGFQVTPIQLARAVASIAGDGNVVQPHTLLNISNAATYSDNFMVGAIDVDKNHFSVVKEGMRQGVTNGIAQVLNVPYVKVAAKTGTAEVGSAKKYANSWITGFFPYDNPKYAFAVVMEKGPRDNLKGAVFVMRSLLDWMAENTPEYLK